MATCLGEGFKIEEKRLNEVLEKAQDFALSSGVSMKSLRNLKGENGSLLAECAPFTLFPSVLSESSLKQIKDCMTDFNTLIHRVAHDHEFLETALKNVLPVDDFTKRLWEIYTKVREEGFTQPLSLGLNRNDFMLDVKNPSHIQPKQIEFNTISASFAGLTTPLIHLHRFTLDMIGKPYEDNQIPDNDPSLGLATGMVKAWELYAEEQYPKSPDLCKAVILFVVSSEERNVFDQRSLEFKAYSVKRSVRVIRRTYLDIDNTAKLTDDKKLLVDGEEVAVIYLRSGYDPDTYKTNKEWDARLMMEQSKAIKCPSIQYQLAGTKKIQQELARAGSVERFIKDKAAVERIRATFVKQHSLDLGPEGNRSVQMAIDHPEEYVLKPQREGGGNNLYGEDMKEFLKQHFESKERNAYILMERIFPPSQKNYLLKSGVPFELSNVVSELGVYGVYIGSETKEEVNTQCGHMMRTKTSGTDEGGICAGFAGLDSPFLVDDQQYQQYLLNRHFCHTPILK